MSSAVKPRFIRTLWGLSIDFTNAKKTKRVFESIKKQGFSGVEIATAFLPRDHRDSVKSILKDLGLDVITQIHTAGYPVKERDYGRHIEDFQKKIEDSIFWDPVLINCHSGRDDWGVETTVNFFQELSKIEKAFNRNISHETHRQRALCNHSVASVIMDRVPEISYTLDLSHWVLSAERHLQPDTDPEFENTLTTLERKTKYIHARVGSTNQIQVINPGQDVDNQSYFYGVWKRLVNKNPGLLINIEYGPVPYAIARPGTQQPIKKIEKLILSELETLSKFL